MRGNDRRRIWGRGIEWEGVGGLEGQGRRVLSEMQTQ